MYRSVRHQDTGKRQHSGTPQKKQKKKKKTHMHTPKKQQKQQQQPTTHVRLNFEHLIIIITIIIIKDMT